DRYTGYNLHNDPRSSKVRPVPVGRGSLGGYVLGLRVTMSRVRSSVSSRTISRSSSRLGTRGASGTGAPSGASGAVGVADAAGVAGVVALAVSVAPGSRVSCM